MRSEIEQYTKFDIIRYAQCWEDADILLEALNIQEGGSYVSIGSAGDNSFAMLAKNPECVTAIDLNVIQLFCIELRREAYRMLDYDTFLYFAGITDKNDDDREKIYVQIRNGMSEACQHYWNQHMDSIRKGFIHCGKFENYFRLFRTYILPIVHTEEEKHDFFMERTDDERKQFYYRVWNNKRWRCLFYIFFSRYFLGKLGRDKAFFNYVDGKVSSRILERIEQGIFDVPMNKTPYIHYVFYGNYEIDNLPFAYRRENYERIKKNVDRLVIRNQCIEEFLTEHKGMKFNGFNMSDIFEYMSEEKMAVCYEQMVNASNPGARIVYWNMLVPRSCPKHLRGRVKEYKELEEMLLRKDKAFFYSKFLIEEVK